MRWWREVFFKCNIRFFLTTWVISTVTSFCRLDLCCLAVLLCAPCTLFFRLSLTIILMTCMGGCGVCWFGQVGYYMSLFLPSYLDGATSYVSISFNLSMPANGIDRMNARCVCVCVCACARVRVRGCVCMSVS